MNLPKQLLVPLLDLFGECRCKESNPAQLTKENSDTSTSPEVCKEPALGDGACQVLLFNREQRRLVLEDVPQDTYYSWNGSQILRSEGTHQMLARQGYETLSKSAALQTSAIRKRIDGNYYLAFEEFQKDLGKMLLWRQINGCHEPVSLYGEYLKLVDKDNILSRFNKEVVQSLKSNCQHLIHLKLPTPGESYVPTFRKYQPLAAYLPTPPGRAANIQRILASQKIPVECPDDCPCLSTGSYCEYDILEGLWKSQCQNRRNKVECDHADPSRAARCRNNEIKFNKSLRCRMFWDPTKLDQEEAYQIREDPTWGIDFHTKLNITATLPDFEDSLQANLVAKATFIEKALLRALNLLKAEASMQKALRLIIDRSSRRVLEPVQSKFLEWSQRLQEDIFSQRDRKMSKKLLHIINLCNRDSFLVHSKGLGAICVSKTGVKRSQFVKQYYGQLYQPWRWFQRQDAMKQFVKQMKCAEIPDFYNIILQKHRNDPSGYDMLYIDPISKGNYASRFSHSCTPNCATITTVSGGRYYIAMYALRDIEYGEELTFDYCSMTETKSEHQKAICLCGTSKCRGRYLELSNSKDSNLVLDKYYSFLERNARLFRACTDPTLSPEDQEVLKEYGLGFSLLGDCPGWLHKWCADSLMYIKFQRKQYQQLLNKQLHRKKKADLTQEQHIYNRARAYDLSENRLQNLVTTISKIKYCLNSVEDQTSPLIALPPDQIIRCRWIGTAGRPSDVDQLFNAVKGQPAVLSKFTQIKSITDELVCGEKGQSLTPEQKLCIIRIALLHFAQVAKVNTAHRASNSNLQAIHDVCYFLAHTYTYFRNWEYKTFESQPLLIPHNEIGAKTQAVKMQAVLEQKCFKEVKKYPSQFVWGQLIGWYKQTVASPQASLSQERRGTLSYPSFQSLNGMLYPFEKNDRKQFLKVIKEKPSSSWPPKKCVWSYKNQQKVYGSCFFQNFYNREKVQLLADILEKDYNPLIYVQLVIDHIDQSFYKKLIFLYLCQQVLGNIASQRVVELAANFSQIVIKAENRIIQPGQQPQKRKIKVKQLD